MSGEREKRELLERLVKEQKKRAKKCASVSGGRKSETRVELPAIEPEELSVSSAYARYVNPYLGHLLFSLGMDKEFVRGEGCYLFDDSGARYLDFIAQYGAVPFGYDPPEIWAAISAARERPSFVQPSILSSAGRLAERLVGLAPEGLRYVTFANSGAEAVEIAIKLCRSATGRKGILSTRGSFHGKTLGAVSATGNAFYQHGFGVPLPDFHHVTYGDVAELESAFAARKGYYAAFVVEPIQGEGGIVEPPSGYLKRASELASRHGAAFVLDEVQTGLGRTGRLFACEEEDFVPDVMTLAKALGGGVLPLAACLSSETIFNQDFALRHSSTFAGNALACEVGLATLDLLERNEQEMIRRVAEHGAFLRARLGRLRDTYPRVLKEVRGRGYMLGLRLDLEQLAARDNLVGFLARQELLPHTVMSYLLNVEQVRIAPTASAGDVLRIQPPLIAHREHCSVLLDALDRTFAVLERGDGARLLAHLVQDVPAAAPPATVPQGRGQRSMPRAEAPVANAERFAFLGHLGEGSQLRDFNSGLDAFTEEQIEELLDRVGPLCSPFVAGTVNVPSRVGGRAWGEVILVPYTAKRLLSLASDAAVAKVARATDVARSRGARMVGLGGFNSIVTQGGVLLRDSGYDSLTTGNSYTVAAGLQALRTACARRNLELGAATVAIVGATGALGRALTRLLAEEAARLTLLGNPRHAGWALDRMRALAGDLLSLDVENGGRRRGPESLASRVAEIISRITETDQRKRLALVRTLEEEQRLVLSTSVEEALRSADVVVTATSSVEAFITARHLKQEAVVCELSRPYNISPEARSDRPDVLFIDGGLVRCPEGSEVNAELGLPTGVVYACLAETILLTLEGLQQNESLGWELDIPTVRRLETLGDKHGFDPII